MFPSRLSDSGPHDQTPLDMIARFREKGGMIPAEGSISIHLLHVASLWDSALVASMSSSGDDMMDVLKRLVDAIILNERACISRKNFSEGSREKHMMERSCPPKPKDIYDGLHVIRSFLEKITSHVKQSAFDSINLSVNMHILMSYLEHYSSETHTFLDILEETYNQLVVFFRDARASDRYDDINRMQPAFRYVARNLASKPFYFRQKDTVKEGRIETMKSIEMLLDLEKMQKEDWFLLVELSITCSFSLAAYAAARTYSLALDDERCKVESLYYIMWCLMCGGKEVELKDMPYTPPPSSIHNIPTFPVDRARLLKMTQGPHPPKKGEFFYRALKELEARLNFHLFQCVNF
eukprot:TRINITY_DN6454_c0_g1_i4.p1 TRINITY_DN6454_c0_g1~~TRINITY_DN6454_c0_g1_i4.p1  ORF type:complete len:351 (-),score=30.46 TRINITY_DN6454_c0_g1_i4:52-1104(-)